MRRYLTICAALLAACGPETAPEVVVVPPPIEPSLLTPCAGWTGPTPTTEGQLADAALAEKRGRVCANGKLAAIAEITRAAEAPAGRLPR